MSRDTAGEDLGVARSLPGLTLLHSQLDLVVDAWMQHLAASEREDGPDCLVDPVVLRRALLAGSVPVDSIEAPVGGSAVAEQWVASFRTAALVIDGTDRVVASNDGASLLLGITPGRPLSSLPFAAPDLQSLVLSMESLRNPPGTQSATHCFRRNHDNAPVIVSVMAIDQGQPHLVGLVTNQMSWPLGLADLLIRAFNLTSTEASVLELLAAGHNVREVAARTSRLESTVRSHVRGILEKTGTRSQVEIIRLVLGLIEALPGHSAQVRAGPKRDAAGAAGGLNLHTLTLGNGRSLDYLVTGAARGRPFVMLPSDCGFVCLPASAEAWLAANGLRMIVPVRGGYGRSSLPSGNDDPVVQAASDMFSLLDHFGIERCPILSFSDDFHTAVVAANEAPQRVQAIAAVGPVMPASTALHLRRMPKWTRFVYANARHLPHVLPVLGYGLFSYARRVGPKQFLQRVLATSPADVMTLEDAETLDALSLGSQVATWPGAAVHIAWAKSAAATYGSDWSNALAACDVPIHLFAGDQDPFSPLATTREIASQHGAIDLRVFEGRGQLLYPLWPEFLGLMRELVETSQT